MKSLDHKAETNKAKFKRIVLKPNNLKEKENNFKE